MILVTAAEQAAARQWLAKRGQPVERPAPLVTALIATRQPLRGGGFRRYFGYLVAGVVAAVLYSLPFGSGATGSGPIYFVYFALALSMRDAIRLRERSLREDGGTPSACGSGVSGRTCRRRTRRTRGGGSSVAGTSRPSCSPSPVGSHSP
jgi:hypothetical protein